MATKVNFRLKSGGGTQSGKPKLSFQLATVMPAKVDFFFLKSGGGRRPEKRKLKPGFQLAALTPSDFVVLTERWRETPTGKT